MNAIIITKPGEPDVMVWQNTADPVPGPADLLVKVKASAVNRADLLQRRGMYPPPPGASPILGMEIAGEIQSVGSQAAANWQPGQRVMSLLSGGGYAELVPVPSVLAVPIPDNLTYEQAAAIPEVFLTAYLNLFMLGNLKKDEIVLIHAGGSGVGTAAIQLAREAGARVFVTAGTDDKLKRCGSLGAAALINYRTESFVKRVQELTESKGVDLILDFIGADYFEDNIASLALNGRLVLIGQMSAGKPQIDLGYVMRRRLHITGSTLRARTLEEKADITRRLVEFALPRFVDGRLVPVVDRVYPMSQASEAHRYMETNANFGKIILRVD